MRAFVLGFGAGTLYMAAATHWLDPLTPAPWWFFAGVIAATGVAAWVGPIFTEKKA